MKKLYYLIVIILISSLVLTGCSLLSNISQVPATDQSGITYLTKSFSNLVGLWRQLPMTAAGIATLEPWLTVLSGWLASLAML